ncbi:hypothetical protein ABT340_35725 [Streptosporangium sp. NPDC000239]|uniref:DUF6941 family protein n=1 Tax=Streptosporangium sp. NPDC000239 TaxID=3154248 RepID=UPI00331F3F5F
MKVTLLLADHVQVAEGKLFVSGGGWSFVGPGRLACGVGVIFHVPWDESGKRITFRVRLVTEAGEVVTRGNPHEDPIEVAGEFEIGRPAYAQPGDDLYMPVAFNAQLQLKPGVYAWQVEVDGRTDEAWRSSFRVCEVAPTRADS